MAIGDKKAVVMQSDIVNDFTTGGATNVLSAEMGKLLAQRPNPNLLDNWYFGNPVDQRHGYIVPNDTAMYTDASCTTTSGNIVSGGPYQGYAISDVCVRFSAGDVFYVKKADCVRGYTSTGYTIDRWKLLGRAHVVTIEAEAITLRKPANTDDFVYAQDFEEATLEFLRGKTATISVMDLNGNVYSKTLLIPASGALDSDNLYIGDNWWIDLIVMSNGEFYIRFVSITKAETILGIQAVKLELGTQQTLAHQDANGNWVLNEIPNYNKELLKCCMSTADSTDTYANNKMTPAAINAVNKTGDTMTGSLKIKLNNDSVGIFESWMDSNFGNANASMGAVHQSLNRMDKITLNSTGPFYQYQLNNKWTTFPIIHTGRKPQGSYTGNGSSTERSIFLNDIIIGHAILIWSNNGSVIVNRINGIGASGTSLRGFDYSSCHFEGNYLKIISTDSLLNENGVLYTYQVL